MRKICGKVFKFLLNNLLCFLLQENVCVRTHKQNKVFEYERWVCSLTLLFKNMFSEIASVYF